ncbi:uncharacterized protein LOC121197975 isoform X2 [Toxotes jaculatrix]|uniref:uncharacterized protein LOC121197975 isoform X2 n=1 Tax=Toxotes jaculatrix TaxID=941984 RepID=UPI001B3AC461|nr:uncharacterized protein LOC121197975 isoform X2 [Toxotes jaculatrix]
MSMAGHSSSMTSWILITFLLLLTFWIHQSKARCHDYFDTNIWLPDLKLDLTRNVTLVNATNAKDIILCTLKNEHNKTTKDDVLYKVFNTCQNDMPQMFPENIKCEGESDDKISLYNFLCLTAKAFDYPEGCKFEPVCWLYSEITASYKPQKETASPKPPEGPDVTLRNMFIISLFLNLVLPLAVYLWMRTKIQSETPRVVTLEPCNDAEAQPMRGAESSSESHSIRPSANTTRNGCPPDELSPH